MNWMMPLGWPFLPRTGPIRKFFTSVVVDWLSTSPTKLVSLSAEFDQCTFIEVKTWPEMPELGGKFMNSWLYSFLRDSCF